ncbi:MAG: ImmA/IrrE family metallo-endopeptidase [Agriterribacter sp.]
MELQQLADSISLDYSSSGAFNPEMVARQLGITYSFGHYGNHFDGLLQHKYGRFHIFLNLDRQENTTGARMRYTFCHELAHYFIDEHRNALKNGQVVAHASFNRLVAHNIAEREADFFAACLLMPSKRFRNFCTRRPISSKLIGDLAKEFGASLSAVVFRYFYLSLSPILIVLSKESKILWKFYSPDFKYRGIPAKDAAVPFNTVAYEFFSTGKEYQSEEIVFADDWFTDERRVKDEQFVEKCYYLPGKKVMSVIWKKEKK